MADPTITADTTTGLTPLSCVFQCVTSGITPTDWQIVYGDGVTETPSGYHLLFADPSDYPHPHVYTTAGTYTVVMTLTNLGGSTATTNTNYIVAVAPTVTATLVVSSTTSGLISDGHVNVIAIATDSSTTNDPLGWKSRLWTLSHTSGTVTSSDNPFTTWVAGNVTNAGWYSLTLTATSMQGVTASTVSTYAFSVPFATVSANFTTAPGSSPVGYTPLSVSFSNQSKGDGRTALWSFGIGTATSTSTTGTVTQTYSTAGQYSVILRVTGSTVTASGVGTTASTLTRTNFVTAVSSGAFRNTVGNLFREAQWHLMGDPDKTCCDAMDEFGGTDNLVTIYYRKLREFLRETEVTQVETTLTAAAGVAVWSLPANLVRLIRVEANGLNINPMDRKQADLAYPDWTTSTNTGEYVGYIYEPEPSLQIQLVPRLTLAPAATVKALYVAAPDTPSIPSDCLTWDALPLPYAVSWVVKWGMIAELLRQEGEMNDPVRAAFAEEIYQMGLQVTKQLLTRRAS